MFKPRGLPLCCALISSQLVLSQLSWADIVKFQNGDQLQGRIVSMQNGVMKLDSSVLGEVSIALDQVDSFAVDDSAELHFKDGTVLKQKVQLAEGRAIQLEPSAVVNAATVPLSQLTTINPPPEAPVEWKGRVSGGIVIDRGNSESQDMQMLVNTSRETKTDRIILDLGFIEKRETNPDTGEENTSKRRYDLSAHYDYFLSPKYYVYGDTNAEKESTANLDLRLTIGAGGGYRWINTDVTQFDIETGLSWVNESFSDQSEDNDYIAARFGWRYSHAFSPATTFIHQGKWIPSLENAEDQLVKTTTGIRTQLNGHLFVEAKVIFDWDQTPADNAEKEDSSYIFGIGWDF